MILTMALLALFALLLLGLVTLAVDSIAEDRILFLPILIGLALLGHLALRGAKAIAPHIGL